MKVILIAHEAEARAHSADLAELVARLQILKMSPVGFSLFLPQPDLAVLFRPLAGDAAAACWLSCPVFCVGALPEHTPGRPGAWRPSWFLGFRCWVFSPRSAHPCPFQLRLL